MYTFKTSPRDSLAALMFCLFTATPYAASAADTPAPASYQADRQAYEAEQAAAQGTGFSDEDRLIMERAAAELAKTLPDPGLKQGEAAPHFSLPNARGQQVSLRKALAQGPVVLVFYRGAWCPYCNLQLHGLKQSRAHFKRYNAQIIAITPQQPDKSLEQLKRDAYPFEVLSDLDDRVTRDYKLYYELSEELDALYKRLGLDVSAYNGAGRTGLPVPGTFVIDTRGIVRAAFADTDYKQRPEPADILAALESLQEER